MEGKHGLMEKLRNLYQDGHLKDVIHEIRHYLGKLSHQSKSPLMLDLLTMFKLVITQDLSELNENLGVLERLLKAPGLDIKAEIVDVFSTLTDIAQLKHVLFERYFPILEHNSRTFDDDTREIAVEVLVSVARGEPALQVRAFEFLLHSVLDATGAAVPGFLRGMLVLIEDEPGLEQHLAGHVGALLDRYLDPIDEDTEPAFVMLFKMSLLHHEVVMERVVAVMTSPDPALKRKALRLVPVVASSDWTLRSFDALVDNLDTRDCELQAEIVETLVDVTRTHLDYFLPRVMKRWLACDDHDLSHVFVDVLVILGGHEFPFMFKKLFDATRVVDGEGEPRVMAAMKALEFEYPRQFDTSLFSILDEFPALHASTKIIVLDKMHAIVKGACKDTLSTWFGKVLKSMDGDVDTHGVEFSSRAGELLEEMKHRLPGLDSRLAELETKIAAIHDAITGMKHYPRVLREKIEAMASDHPVDHRSTMLDKEYTAFINKIVTFEMGLNKLEFKHFIMDIVDEWYATKEYILDDLNVVKEYLHERIHESHALVEEEMNGLVPRLQAKLESLRVDLEDIESKGIVELSSEEIRSSYLDSLLSLEFDAVLLDLEIGTKKTRYVVPSTVLAGFLDAWEHVHARIAAVLAARGAALRNWYDEVLKGSPDRTDLESFLMVQGFFITRIHDIMQQFQDNLETLASIMNVPLGTSMSELHKAGRALTYNFHRTMDFIDEKHHEIDRWWRRFGQDVRDIEIILSLRHAKEEWDTFSTNLREHVSRLYKEKLELIDAEQVKNLLSLVKPVPLALLQDRLHSIDTTDEVEFISKVLDMIRKYNIDATVKDTTILDPSDYMTGLRSMDVLKLKTSVELEGDVMLFMVHLENIDVHDLVDVIVSCHRIDATLHQAREVHKEVLPVLESGHVTLLSWEISIPRSSPPVVNSSRARTVKPVEFTISAQGTRSGSTFSKRDTIHVLLA